MTCLIFETDKSYAKLSAYNLGSDKKLFNMCMLMLGHNYVRRIFESYNCDYHNVTDASICVSFFY